nr:hypothetical protein [Micromonospora globispora]
MANSSARPAMPRTVRVIRDGLRTSSAQPSEAARRRAVSSAVIPAAQKKFTWPRSSTSTGGGWPAMALSTTSTSR